MQNATLIGAGISLVSFIVEIKETIPRKIFLGASLMSTIILGFVSIYLFTQS